MLLAIVVDLPYVLTERGPLRDDKLVLQGLGDEHDVVSHTSNKR